MPIREQHKKGKLGSRSLRIENDEPNALNMYIELHKIPNILAAALFLNVVHKATANTTVTTEKAIGTTNF